jgi:hypothetical protein
MTRTATDVAPWRSWATVARSSAWLVINYADNKTEATAIEPCATANEVHLRFYGKDNLLHAALNVEGATKPAWQLDDAASVARAMKH